MKRHSSSKVRTRTMLCGTCDEKIGTFSLDEERSLKGTEKVSLYEMLQEVAKIDLDANQKLNFKICNFCVKKLETAYLFVIKARTVNEKYKATSLGTEIDKDPTTLTDSCPTSEEGDDGSDYEESQNSSDFDVEKEETQRRRTKRKPERSPVKRGAKRKPSKKGCYKCDICGKTYSTSTGLSRHRNVHTQHLIFECQHCNRRFLRSDHLKEHLKAHNSKCDNKKSAESSEIFQKYLFSIPNDMCKPHGRKIIKCLLCNSVHAKSIDLKAHLLLHQFNLTFNGNAEEIFSQFYQEKSKRRKKLNESAVLERIKNEIADENLNHFYSITNERGYELAISSSETDTETEDNDNGIDEYSDQINIKDFEKYICDLCGLCFNRKYKAFHHQNTEHKSQSLPHACSHCDKKFIDNKLLEWHLSRQCENKKKKFVCIECEMRFMWKENLRQHTLVSHQENPIKKSLDTIELFECSQCDLKFLTENDLSGHSAIHDATTKRIKCPFCLCGFSKELDLRAHIYMHGISIKNLPIAKSIFQATVLRNGPKEIICKNCNAKFKTIVELRKHHEDKSLCNAEKNSDGRTGNYSISNELGFELDINDSESDDNEIENSRQYTCALCSLSFKRKFEIAKHQRSTHAYDLLPLKCDKCIFKTVSPDILDHHKRTQCENTEKMHQCESCNFKFMWPENLKKHQELLHANAEASEDVTMFECEHCPHRYNRKVQLSKHIKKMHPKLLCVPAKGRTKKKPVKRNKNSKLSCSLCGSPFNDPYDLKIHMRRHLGEKPYKCKHCDKGFAKASDLESHRRRHTGEKPHTCPTCGKSFVRGHKLTLHLRVHSKEKPYKCKYKNCGKAFAYPASLTVHLRQHTGEKPFVCGICGEKFIEGTALKKHRMTEEHFEQEEPRRSVLESFL